MEARAKKKEEGGEWGGGRVRRGESEEGGE